MSKDEVPKEVEREIRALLDAMDRQHGQPVFSLNVDAARSNLRVRFPRVLNVRDKSRGAKAA